MAKTLRARHPRKSTFAGRHKAIHRKQPEELPFLREALAWLLAANGKRPLVQLIQLARIPRVIIGRGSGWHAQRGVIDALIRRVRTQPSAKAIYGLGELIAFSSRDAAPLLPSLATLRDRQVGDLLNRMEQLARLRTAPVAVDEMMIGERLADVDLSTTTFDYARTYIEHPPRVYRRIFGLSVATETFLVLHPRAFGKWLSRKHWPPISHTILSAVAERLIFSSGDVFAVRALQSSVPLLQAMAAVAQVQRFLGRPPKSFAEIHGWCRASGLDGDRAFVLALPGLEPELIARRRLRDKLATDQNAYCMSVLKQFSRSDPKGHAVSLATLADEQSQLTVEESRIDSVLSLVADNWPCDGLTDPIADVIFDMLRPDSVELCSRLVDKAAEKSGADALRHRIVAEVFSLIGLQNPDHFLTSQYLPPHALPESCAFAAAQFAALQRKVGKSLGQQTSLRVGALVARANTIVLAPYAAARGLHYTPPSRSKLRRCCLRSPWSAKGLGSARTWSACWPISWMPRKFYCEQTGHPIRIILWSTRSRA